MFYLRALFKTHLDGALLVEIQNETNKDLAIGKKRFKKESEVLTGRRMLPSQMGRPPQV